MLRSAQRIPFPLCLGQADDGPRTRDLKLGKLALYQLSYVRAPGNVAPAVTRLVGDLDAPAGDTPGELYPIGTVESSLADRAVAPKQGREGDAPSATLVLHPRYEPALEGLGRGDRVIVVTWLHRADREVLRVHPRDDRSNPMRGVFSTRSADRPNPIGLHEVEVVAIEGVRVQVDALEAVHGTPILDLKPVLR